MLCTAILSGTAGFLQMKAALEKQKADQAKHAALSTERWERVEDFEDKLAIFKTVFWEPRDTDSLRKRIRETDVVRDKSVLEIGVGSGLLSLCCAKAGAKRVVGTDINPNAIQCARYNARTLGFDRIASFRLTAANHPEAFAVISPQERFDVIVSNPPWEDGKPKYVDQYALYDPNFSLMDSILGGLDKHLNPGGQALLAYGCKTAIIQLQERGPRFGYQVEVLDDRALEDLEELFLPGMLLRLTRISK